ncbi:hypothetical protein K466DRAFT_228645 [Polyporus arcularius HHB13444]|uniref:Uncharacterized protein n=1 Tax=Polyporus arcularius HHB13444 TaxID=1314778 RepID=A0A5C3PTI3_9APHY|nr:hypothetical protein K466DRAFT_228645 [Polyporus arcularius HHB13444]
MWAVVARLIGLAKSGIVERATTRARRSRGERWSSAEARGPAGRALHPIIAQAPRGREQMEREKMVRDGDRARGPIAAGARTLRGPPHEESAKEHVVVERLTYVITASVKDGREAQSTQQTKAVQHWTNPSRIRSAPAARATVYKLPRDLGKASGIGQVRFKPA